jgi:magnesium chelatase family protein
MTLAEAIETTHLHRVAGFTGARTALITMQPFWVPHHTISAVGLIGGGQVPTPGEVSLAHHGVRLLDALPEFRRHVLEVLRQPLDNSSTSRAYSAMFQAAQVALEAAGFTRPEWSHAGLHATFAYELTRRQQQYSSCPRAI